MKGNKDMMKEKTIDDVIEEIRDLYKFIVYFFLSSIILFVLLIAFISIFVINKI